MFSEAEEDRDWRLYVGDMIEFAEKVLSYTSGLDQAAFVADTLTYDATLRNMELIGEAATHVPDEIPKNTRKSNGGVLSQRETGWRTAISALMMMLSGTSSKPILLNYYRHYETC